MGKRKLILYGLMVAMMPLLLLLPMKSYAKVTEIFYDGESTQYERFPSMYIDDVKMVDGIMPPIITKSQRTLVPVREFFESIGDNVVWDGKKKQVHIYHEEKELVIAIGSYIVWLNGEEITMDETAKLVINKTDNPNQSKTMVPLRFIMENFGFDVEWDGGEYSIRMTSQAPKKTKLFDEPITWKVDGAIKKLTPPSSDILQKNYKTTNILGIDEKTQDKTLTYTIKADSKISKVKSTLWNNMLIIDIEGSIKAFEDELIELSDNPYFKQIRASQFKDNPKITRIVFDMKYEELAYDLKLDSERKNLVLKVTQNLVQQIHLGQDDEGDYLDITGYFQPALNIFWLSNPTRLVVDVPYSDSVFKYKEQEAGGIYVDALRTAKFDDTTARIVLDLSKRAEFQIQALDEQTTRIRLVKPNYQNITVEYGTYPQIVIKKRSGIMASDINIQDNYRVRQGVFTITNKDLLGVYGSGQIHVNDDDIRKINLYQDEEGYHLAMDTKVVKAYKITEDDKNIYIKVMPPQDLYDKVIVVDPGHGGTDPGKPISKGNYTYKNEKEINLDISLRLYNLLKQHGEMKVYMTRETDMYPTLPERCDLANEVEADFFVSIHNNAFMSKFEGTEMLYYDPYNGKTKKFATIMQDSLVKEAGTIDRGLRYRSDLFVLKHTKMSAVIVEVAYMTNQNDAKKLLNDNFLQRSAVGIYNGIVKSYSQLR